MCARKYYAVVSGREPGIYTDWSICNKMVSGYPGAIYKSFPTRAEAEKFVNISTHKPNVEVIHDAVPFIDKTKIYTDGSYKNNKAGYGIIIIPPSGDKITVYGMVPELMKQSNNVAELYAIYIALSLSSSNNIIMYVDSMYAMNTLTSWIHGWKADGWVGVANVDLIKSIYNKMSERQITFQHVHAHKGHKMNEEVDELAKKGRESRKEMVINWNGVPYLN